MMQRRSERKASSLKPVPWKDVHVFWTSSSCDSTCPENTETLQPVPWNSLHPAPRSGPFDKLKTQNMPWKDVEEQNDLTVRRLSSIYSNNENPIEGIGLDHHIEVMPDEDQVIKTGMLFKLRHFGGTIQMWESRDILLTAERFSYSIETSASNAWNTLGRRVAESIPLLNIQQVVSDADEMMQMSVGCCSRMSESLLKKVESEAAVTKRGTTLYIHIGTVTHQHTQAHTHMDLFIY